MKVLKAKILTTAAWGKGKQSEHAVDTPKFLAKKRIGNRIGRKKINFKKLLCALENQQGQLISMDGHIPNKVMKKTLSFDLKLTFRLQEGSEG